MAPKMLQTPALFAGGFKKSFSLVGAGLDNTADHGARRCAKRILHT